MYFRRSFFAIWVPARALVALKVMLAVEEAGGFYAALKAGTVQAAVNESNKARHKAVAQRREVLLGTNQFPNFNEKAGNKQPVEGKALLSRLQPFVQPFKEGTLNTPNVIGFLGGSEKPVPLRQSEVNRILGTVDELQETGEELNIPYVVGETVKVTFGPFSGFSGIIEEVNSEKKKLKVMVKIFGRKTPLELGFMQVEKE